MRPASPAARFRQSLTRYLSVAMAMPWDYSSDVHGPDPIDPNNPNPCGWVVPTRRTDDRAALDRQSHGELTASFRILASHADPSVAIDCLLDCEWQLEALLQSLRVQGLPEFLSVSARKTDQGATFEPRVVEAIQPDGSAIVTALCRVDYRLNY
jgi:hypothetical protein